MELRRALLPLVMLSLLCVRAEAARHILEAGYTGSSRSTSIKRSLIVDTPKLERLIRNSKYRGTPAELVKQLLREKDLVVDHTNEALVYACRGLDMTPGSKAAAANAASQAAQLAALGAATPSGGDAAQITPTSNTMQPLDQPAISSDGEPGSLTGHHHHHHHHRHLLATGNPELPSVWTPDVPDAPITKQQAFTLHSRPGAEHKILLDFDGHVTTGTKWNTFRLGSTIATPPYDTDNDRTSFSTSELADILLMWRSVAEDFAPFDADITTEEPQDATWINKGARIAVGGTAFDWCSNGTFNCGGGIAYVNSFGNPSQNPSFCFPVELGREPRNIRDCISHELGHQLGLSHDGIVVGNTTYEYLSSNIIRSREWGTIMGNPYGSIIAQFSKGEYTNATNTEDDFQIINGHLPYITDMYGGTLANATLAAGTTDANGVAIAQIMGVIRDPDDTDMMSFRAAPGTVNVKVLSVPGVPPLSFFVEGYPRTNLFMKVEVRDSNDNVLKTQTGADVLTFDYTIPTNGTYYVSIAGTGNGDPKTPPGFSTYGSRGQYQLTVAYVNGENVLCSAPPAISTNATSGTFTCPANSPVNFVCQSVCDASAGYVGSPSITCLSTAEWSAVAGSCQPGCSTQPAARNAAFTCPATLVGQSCTATCSRGFIPAPNGAPAAVCQATTTVPVAAWGKTTGRCVAVVCSEKLSNNKPANAVWPKNCVPGLPDSICTAACPRTKDPTQPLPSATCTLNSDGTAASWEITGTCA